MLFNVWLKLNISSQLIKGGGYGTALHDTIRIKY